MYVSEVESLNEGIGYVADGKSILVEYLKKLEDCDCEILEDVEFLA